MQNNSDSLIYFDNAATTWPKPAAVADEMIRALNDYGGNPGRSGHRLSIGATEAIYACREAVCGLFGSEHPENVVFTCSDTMALNLAIKALVKCGDHILISNIEHNSVLRPVTALGQIGVSCSIFNVFPDASEARVLTAMSECLKPETRMVIASHRSNVCGITLPIEAMGRFCREHGLIFIVDAAQSAGVLPLDIERIGADVICAPGHKGLYGPQGSGFALFSAKYAGDVSEMLDTYVEGGNGVDSLDPMMPRYLPERYEAGTLSTPCIAGLRCGIEFVRERGMEELEAIESALYRRLRDLLCGTRRIKVYLPQAERSSVLLFNAVGCTAGELASELDRRGICVRSGFHCSPLAHRALGTGADGAVRVSFGAFNCMREVDLFYRAIREILFK